VKVLQAAGKNLTRTGFVDGLRKINSYPAAGLTCAPYDFSAANYGKINTDNCSWFTAVKNGKFVVLNKGKPLTGKLVGDPATLQKYTAGGGGIPTTAAGG